MALIKELMSSVRARTYTDDLPSLYGADKYPKLAVEEGNINSFDKLLTMSRSSSPLGSSNSANSHEFALEAAGHHAKEPHQPLINFKAKDTTSGHNDSSFIQADSGSLLSFQQNEDYSGWEPGSISYWDNCPSPKCSSDVRSFQDSNSFQTASNFSPMIRTQKDDHGNWLYTQSTIVTDSIQEPASDEANLQKRSYMGESLQAAKKQCNNPSSSKKTKPKVESSSKDPQSIAAKQRRERISERLKTLQELVPNGSKVDLVTMLEKAINYVKFLQLQVKVLATDELWPVQGGKAPDVSQVKEVIDAILSSQRDNSSSNSK